MTYENALAAIGLLGIGGAVGTYFRILWERKKETQLHKQDFKEVRYKCTILLMYASLDFDSQAHNLNSHGRGFQKPEELRDELLTEWHNMILFASEDVLVAVHDFISKPSHDNFRRSAIAMRVDLWGGKVSKQIVDLQFPESSAGVNAAS